jgi:hypothetical protein
LYAAILHLFAIHLLTSPQDQIHSRWSDVESAFAEIDTSGQYVRNSFCNFVIFFLGDGLVSLDEFSRLVSGLGLEHATPGTIVALFNKYVGS